MNRSVIAILLIFMLSMSGCKAQQEASSAIPAERIEIDAEAGQKEPLIVPNESDPEEEQPAEEDQVTQEQPAEESEDPEIVKFWETVPEMSIDEAKVIVKAKLERIKREEKLGTLTDEERMAFYVLNCNYYDALIKKDAIMAKHFSDLADQVLFKIQIESAFIGDVEEYFQKYSWEDENFAEEHLDERFIRYDRIYPMSDGMMRFGYRYVSKDVYDMGYGFGDEVKISHSPNGIIIYIYGTTGEMIKNAEKSEELYRDILKHYLSLKSVAFIEGPEYFSFDKLC